MVRFASIFCALLWLVASSVGCSGCSSESPGASESGEDTGPAWRTAVAIIDTLETCDVEHRGLLVDLGTGVLNGRHGYQLDDPLGIVTSEHDGATWARIFDRKVSFSFYLPQATEVFVALRGIGRDSKRITISVDRLTMGTVKLKKDEIRIAETRKTRLPLDAGVHHLTLHFRGHRGIKTDPFGEVDWIRIGVPDELERTYGAPTFDDVVAPAAQLAQVPHRALSMRAPGAVRCTVRIPPRARLRTSVGMRGSGRATAAILIREEGEDPLVLERVDVKGGDDASWTDVEVSLHAYAGRIVSIELAGTETTGTGRLLIGDPIIEIPTKPKPPRHVAKAVVVVVVDGVERPDLPPWREGKSPHLPAFNRLASEAAVFHGHRAPSTLVTATVASILTGLSPRHHTAVDSGAVLPPDVRTVSDIAREASVVARMFTGVPTTFKPFGFDQDWDQFAQYPPNEGRLASAPMDDVGDWLEAAELEEGRPVLAILHVRGGHPPWDVTPDEAKKLPPSDYSTGYLSPRRAAQTIAETQGRQSKFSDADRERMSALYHAGLSRQDEALGRLIRRLKVKGLWDDTLFVVTGDVSSARRTLFVDGGDLDEDLLALPLYVHFPGGHHAGVRVEEETEVYDITQSIIAALDLKAPQEMLGSDLALIAGGNSPDSQRIRAAFTHELYAARWADFTLRGEIGKRPRLCRLSIDPTCQYDRTHQYPAIAQALFRRLVAFDKTKSDTTERVRLRLTPEQSAWLDVWGSYYKNL